jgi:glycosyltransferase involved in cell wall biosynthesis
MRIAQVAPLFARVPPETYGGTERVVSFLTEELVRRGHDVTLFATADARTKARLRPILNCSLYDTWAQSGYWKPEYAHLASAAEALRDSGEFDLVHFHMGTFSIPLAALARVPTIHSLPSPLGAEDLWTLDRFPEATVTARSHRQIRQAPEERRAGIHVVPNGCDFDFLDFAPGPRPYLVFLGRICEEKNPLDAILAAQRVGMPIVLAGEPWDEGDGEYFEQKIRPMLREPDVRWIGAVNDAQKRDLLGQAAALLFPIRCEEAFGIVMIEAMACGAPVIAYDRGGVAEVIETGVTGFVCDTLEQMAALTPRAVALDNAAVRAAARPRFSVAALGDGYLSLYNQVVSLAAGLR